jgi:hypothetical protein
LALASFSDACNRNAIPAVTLPDLKQPQQSKGSQMQTTFDLLSTEVRIYSQESPEEIIIDLLSKKFGITQAKAKSIRLFYIRGVSHQKTAPDDERDVVILTPEFLYVLDLGFPSLCGVTIPWKNEGLGAPVFPDFTRAAYRSVSGLQPRQLVYPLIPGDILIGIKGGTPEKEILDGLAPFCSNVKPFSTDLYRANITPFHESEVIAKMENGVSFVKYVSPNQIVRLNDFTPGWSVSQIL